MSGLFRSQANVLLARLFADAPSAQARLSRHAGKVVRLRHPLGWALVQIDPATIQVIDARWGNPGGDDAEVTRAADLHIELRDVLPDPAALGFDGLLRGASISGPADLADDFSQALRSLRIDLADWIAPWTGDIIAHRIELAGRSLLSGGLDLASRAAQQLSTRLGSDAGAVVGGAQGKLRSAEIHAAFDATQALESRVARLETRRR